MLKRNQKNNQARKVNINPYYLKTLNFSIYYKLSQKLQKIESLYKPYIIATRY